MKIGIFFLSFLACVNLYSQEIQTKPSDFLIIDRNIFMIRGANRIHLMDPFDQIRYLDNAGLLYLSQDTIRKVEFDSEWYSSKKFPDYIEWKEYDLKDLILHNYVIVYKKDGSISFYWEYSIPTGNVKDGGFEWRRLYEYKLYRTPEFILSKEESLDLLNRGKIK